MRKEATIILIITVLLCSGIYAADFEISSYNVEHRESFDGFQGTYATLPAGFAVSKDGINMMGPDDIDFKGVSTGMVTAGGCYAWTVNTNDNAIGFQPIGDKYTPGAIVMVISNASGAVCKRIRLSVDIMCLNNGDRSSSISIEMSTNGVSYTAVTNGVFATPLMKDSSADWKAYKLSEEWRLAKGVYLKPGDRLWIRWLSNDAGGSESRDEVGIDNVAITLKKEEGSLLILR